MRAALLLLVFLGCTEDVLPDPPPARQQSRAEAPAPVRVESPQEQVCGSTCYDDSDCQRGALCNTNGPWFCTSEDEQPTLDCTSNSDCSGTRRCHFGQVGWCGAGWSLEKCQVECLGFGVCRSMFPASGRGVCSVPCGDDDDCGGDFCEPLVR